MKKSLIVLFIIIIVFLITIFEYHFTFQFNDNYIENDLINMDSVNLNGEILINDNDSIFDL